MAPISRIAPPIWQARRSERRKAARQSSAGTVLNAREAMVVPYVLGGA